MCFAKPCPPDNQVKSKGLKRLLAWGGFPLLAVKHRAWLISATCPEAVRGPAAAGRCGFRDCGGERPHRGGPAGGKLRVTGGWRLGTEVSAQYRQDYATKRAAGITEEKMDRLSDGFGFDPFGKTRFGHGAAIGVSVHSPGHHAMHSDVRVLQFRGQDFGKLADRAF